MKILNKLTIKHLKSNPKRTVVTIIGIILSTALMVGIGLLFSTLRDNSVKMIEENNGKHHVMIEVEKSKMDIITKNASVKHYSYTSSLGYAKYDEITNEYKPYFHVLSASKEYLEELKIVEGRLPINENEIIISNHIESNGGVKLKVGDKIKLEVGIRVDEEGEELGDTPYVNETSKEFDENGNVTVTSETKKETLKETVTKEYTIVGICQRVSQEQYSSPGYSVFTTNDVADKLKMYVNYKKVKDTYKNTDSIAANLGYVSSGDGYKFYEEVEYNSSLLSVNGVTTYDNVSSTMAWTICIILFLVSIACVIVIYNAFAISVMERKKQFGLFSSIGSTKKQLRYTVFYEAFLVSIIGIPLGIVSAYIGIGAVLMIINHLLPDVFSFPLTLVTYPLFVIIPVVFMIITIIISAYLPAKRASKVSPIEAIRQNDDIKIKSKKIKSPKIIRKVFGVEGELAYKNMKRNKKKYRITIISLFISIVLFISFSSLVKYGLESAYDFTEMPNFEYSVNISNKEAGNEKKEEVVSSIINVDTIKQYNVITSPSYSTTTEDNNLYSDEFNNKINVNHNYKESSLNVVIMKLSNNGYEAYKKQLGLTSNRPILLNTFSQIIYTNNSRKQITITPFKEFSTLNISTYNKETNDWDKQYTLKNIYSTSTLPFGMMASQLDPTYSITLIVNEEIFEEIYGKDATTSIFIAINASNYDSLDKIVEGYKNDVSVYVNSYNLKEEMKLMSNMILVIKILLYGFISLVTLIGVTSVLNTINTSIALRRTEFAVLRSIGLTPKGFNKILFFESLFFGLKSLLYGIPVGIGITILLHLSMSGIVTFDKLLLPWDSILICILGVFIIIAISMWYSARKIKKENILDAIRDETI